MEGQLDDDGGIPSETEDMRIHRGSGKSNGIDSKNHRI